MKNLSKLEKEPKINIELEIMSTCLERGFHLTYLGMEDTGLSRRIGIGEKFLKGHPRIEIYVEGRKPVHVLIKDVPQCSKADEGVLSDEELEKVYKWITINKEILLKHWNLQVYSLGLILGLKPYC